MNAANKLDAKTLGTMLREEFDRDKWGTIEVYWFNDDDGEFWCDMLKVLNRVADRLNKLLE